MKNPFGTAPLSALLFSVCIAKTSLGFQSSHGLYTPSIISCARTPNNFLTSSSRKNVNFTSSLCVPNVIKNTSSRNTSSLSMSAGTSAIEVPDSNNGKKGFFSKMKSSIPPKSEMKKLVPLALMFFCILFNYTILRDTKDVLMITAPKSGAEVIPFIKTYVNLPTAIGFTALYSKLCDKMDQKNVFYTCTIPFLIFFGLFASTIYPSIGFLHPHAFVDKMASILPAGFSAPLSIIRNWSFAVFYVMAEMWGSVVASLLFWSFANTVTTVDEAKKYCESFLCP